MPAPLSNTLTDICGNHGAAAMSLFERFEALIRAGRREEAVAVVEKAADGGEAEALLALAQWRLYGMHGARDPAAAGALLQRAARYGSIEAARLRAILTGNGAVGPPDPGLAQAMMAEIAGEDAEAASQVAAAAAIDALPIPDPETLCEDPPVKLHRAFLDDAACAWLIGRAAPRLQPSFVIDPASGRRLPHPVRTSDGMNFAPSIEDLAVQAVNRRIAAASGTEPACGEPLHVLRYSGGQQYRPHLDALPAAANQRRWTMLVYLNDDYEGGETEFDLLGLKVRGAAGDALLFRNVGADGGPEPRSRHAGLPVSRGTKWLATRWIRERPHDPWQGS